MAVITLARSSASAHVPYLPDGCVLVTPSDDTFSVPVSIYVGGTAGNLVVTPANGTTDVTVAVAANSILPFRVIAVKAASTATPIHAMY